MPIPSIPERPRLSGEENAAYISFRVRQIAWFERLAALAGAASILTFIWWDDFMFDVPLTNTLYIRLALAALLLIMLVITFTKLGTLHVWTQAFATIVVVAGFSAILARLPDGFTVGLAGLALSAALLPMLAATFGQILVLTAIAVATPNLFLIGTDAPRATFVNVNLWMLWPVGWQWRSGSSSTPSIGASSSANATWQPSESGPTACSRTYSRIPLQSS